MIKTQGKINVELTGDGNVNGDDVLKILRWIAKIITDAELAPPAK